MVLSSDIVFDLVTGLMVPISFIINKTLYTNVKNEKHLEKGKIVQQIIKTFALVQCVSIPCIAIFHALIYVCIVTLECIEITTARYLISAFKCAFVYYIDFVGLHSLIIAISRYAFLVFDSQTERFGVQRLRKVLILSSLCVPLITTFLYDATYSNKNFPYLCRYLNGCQSSHIRTVNGSVNVNEDHGSNEYDSPLYIIVNESFPNQFKYGLEIFMWVLLFPIYSNVFEGFIYIHTWIVMKRYYIKC